MADLVVNGDVLEVHLSATERLESLHGNISVPLSAVRTVDVLDDAMKAIHGMRVGTGIPGMTAVGNFLAKNSRVFAVIHHDEHRGVRVKLEGASFDELIIGCANPQEVADAIPVTAT